MFEENNIDELQSSIDLLTNDAIVRLRKAIADSGERSLTVLVDPVLGDSVLNLCEVHGLSSFRLDVPYGDVRDDIKPYVVFVNEEETHERFVNATISMAVQESIAARDEWPAQRSVCGWLIMDEEQRKRFSKGFSARAVMRGMANSSQRQLLRFWDPRVLPQLARIVGQPAWSSWMNMTMAWLSIDAWGRITEHHFRTIPNEAGAHLSYIEVDTQALDRIAEINHCLTLSGELNKSPDERLYDRFSALLARATELGCTRAVDRVTYAVVADSMRLPFDRHPEIAAMLSQSRQDDASFADLLSVLEPGDWDRIRSDLVGISVSDKSSISM